MIMNTALETKDLAYDELLRFEHVHIRYGERELVHDISFSLKAGEILGIAGESGSGKSSLIRAALGLLGNSGRVSLGSIYYKGDNILEYSQSQMQKLRGAEIGMIFQDSASSLCPIRRIGSQMYESMKAHMKISKKQAENKALDLLEKLGLEDPKAILKSYPFELSGGMNQRVGIALSMLLEPRVLLADEPSSALDVIVQEQVICEFKKLNRIFNTAIILISHDIALLGSLADKILVLKDGSCMDYGSKDEIFSSKSSPYTQELLKAIPYLH